MGDSVSVGAAECRVSEPLTVPSRTDAESGVIVSGEFDVTLPVESAVSALTRMRRECSKTSCVKIAWVRTKVRAFEKKT